MFEPLKTSEVGIRPSVFTAFMKDMLSETALSAVTGGHKRGYLEVAAAADGGCAAPSRVLLPVLLLSLIHI